MRWMTKHGGLSAFGDSGSAMPTQETRLCSDEISCALVLRIVESLTGVQRMRCCAHSPDRMLSTSLRGTGMGALLTAGLKW